MWKETLNGRGHGIEARTGVGGGVSLLLPSRVSLVIFLLAWVGVGFARERVDLTGLWRFAPDPMNLGEDHGWHQSGGPFKDWFEVTVPHCWTVDPRFSSPGSAWYRKSFSLQSVAPSRQRVRLVFKRVFYRSKVWLNGQLAGEHEGGYTPFEFDVTPLVRWQGANTLVVQVNNTWSTNTLPGARPGSRPQEQVYPWLEYGGILDAVDLVITDPVSIVKQRILAEPDRATGGASIQVIAGIGNAGEEAVNIRLECSVMLHGANQAELTMAASVPPHRESSVTMRVDLPAAQVKLWDLDHPVLYALDSKLWRAGGETRVLLDEPEPVSFGIRKIEARSAALFLNGEPVRLGGGNRHADHPRFGSMDPPELVDNDLRLMKQANMDLSRISHYPVSETLLDWADQHGLLIIEEGLNWQLTEAQMDSPDIRRKFQAQMREMIERDGNHPCVIGWSVGNEYASETSGGLNWTRDMVDFVRGLDSTRLLTFASDKAGLPRVAQATAEGSCYVDLICVNLYQDYAERLDRIHAMWPDKPVMVSEFAAAGHAKLSDSEYAPYFRGMMAVFRERPYVVGAAVWTFNDYRSRYPGTGPDGYRHYGAVDAERRTKPAYGLLAGEFAPVLIRDGRFARGAGSGGEVSVSATIQARDDFPSYPLRDFAVRCQLRAADGKVLVSRTQVLPLLKPGAQSPFHATLKLASPEPVTGWIEILRPTGFGVVAQTFSLSP